MTALLRKKKVRLIIGSGLVALVLATTSLWLLSADTNVTASDLPQFERVGIIESADPASRSFIIAARNPHSGGIQRIRIQYDEKTLVFLVRSFRDDNGVLYYEETTSRPISTVRVGALVTVYFVRKDGRFVAERIEYGRD